MRALLLLLASAACVADSLAPEQFARYVPLQTQSSAALYQATLSADVYRHAIAADLSDLRVFNAAGESVPYSLEQVLPTPVPQAEVSLPFFAESRQAEASASVAVSVRAGTDGTLVSVQPGKPVPLAGAQTVLVDASRLKRPLAALSLDWAEPRFQGALQVDASDDLSQWQQVASGELLRLSLAGQKLEQRRLPLGELSARYLRLRWQGSAPTLTAVRVTPSVPPPAPTRAWLAAQPLQSNEAGIYRFALANVVPADRLRIVLPQANTVANVTLEARMQSSGPWHAVARARLYRLHQASGETRSGDLIVPARVFREWRIRVDGGAVAIGQGQPGLSLGWVPQRLTWLARGQPPFVLAYGQRGLTGAAQPAASLRINGSRPAPATLGVPRDGTLQVAPLIERELLRRGVLWAVLLAGVGVLGWMAWRLGRRGDGM
ncbi:DUF3999 domain-containing protein [Chitinolyticbacter albus]|uniref:DUF3999 domain-containing protein n=1 Tax=Chitinolyticbacter albus TaxID=2961951 RepID=UPI002108C3CC|nr:DUF3999 domain-containing protein [Chitinolyticbacter albus]